MGPFVLRMVLMLALLFVISGATLLDGVDVATGLILKRFDEAVVFLALIAVYKLLAAVEFTPLVVG
jgi:hypothetical protein